jgi:hypothetical protein
MAEIADRLGAGDVEAVIRARKDLRLERGALAFGPGDADIILGIGELAAGVRQGSRRTTRMAMLSPAGSIAAIIAAPAENGKPEAPAVHVLCVTGY